MAKFLINPITGELNISLNKASEQKYDNTTSGLTATDLQAAVDELAAAQEAAKVEYRTISAPEAAAKQLTLAAAPVDVTEVQLGIAGGGTQIVNDDFLVTGSTLSWNGLGLDGILSAGDKVCIVYAV